MSMLSCHNGVPAIDRETVTRDVRSPLLICAAVLLTAAALLAIPGLISPFTKAGREAFFLKLIIAEVDEGTYGEWFFLHCFTYVLAFVGPLLSAVGLWITTLAAKKSPAAGARYFVGLARFYHGFSWAATVALGALFLIRVILYFLKEAFQVGGFLFIAAMLLPELVFAAVVAIVAVTAVRWTKSAIHTAENIRYNLLSGQCRSYSMNGSTAAAFILTGVFAFAIALLHWGWIVPMLAFGLTFAGNLLAGIWIRRYQQRTDRRIFAAQRMAEGKSVSFKL